MSGTENKQVYHFLVVDDDKDSRLTVAEYLRSVGYSRITMAADGSEALRVLLRDASINFVISDWDMPLMNGLTLLQRVKADPARAQIPFLIITSPISQEAEKIVLAAENLVDGYLIKPFRVHVLEEKIEKILESPVRGLQRQAVVVDDDQGAREMVVEYLQKIGFKDIQGIAGGKAALAYIHQNAAKIALIVSDWEMPDVNGLELLRACKATPALQKIPFLMITSQSSIEKMKVLQAAKANVDEYLLKPFSIEDMKKRIEDAMQKSRHWNEILSLRNEAQEHLEHGRYQRAQERLEELLRIDPTNETGLRGMGDALVKLKGVETALPWYKKAVDAAPMNPAGYTKLATAYDQVGLIDQAVALLQNASRQISFSAELHFQLGRLYNKKNMPLLARQEFEKTLELQLDHQEARLMLQLLSVGHGKG